jgi:hypothetical protein
MDHIQPANVGNYLANEDWWFYLPAILFVDTVVIFLARFFPKTFGTSINVWYDEFGLAAVLSDVGIIAIGIAIGVFIGSTMFRNIDQCEGVIQENKLLKDLIYQYENYIIESP